MKRWFILFLIFVSHLFLSACSGPDQDDFLKRGNEFYIQKKYDLAIKQYDQAIGRKRDLSVAYICKGLALEYLGKFQEAIDNYNVLLKINPSQNEALIRREYRSGCQNK
jgi:tetratricopeptide (TPR) repeat protein